MQGDRKDPVSISNWFLRQRNLLRVTLLVELLQSNRQKHSVSSTRLHTPSFWKDKQCRSAHTQQQAPHWRGSHRLSNSPPEALLVRILSLNKDSRIMCVYACVHVYVYILTKLPNTMAGLRHLTSNTSDEVRISITSNEISFKIYKMP